MTTDAAATFEPHRQFLVGVAYRMLGSVAEAEDAVQDAFLRWQGVTDAVQEPRAYLARVVTRLCLDRLKSARVRREDYVGTWLPEPLVAEPGDDAAHRANDISVALLMTLERLSPLERAAFLLRDVFDMDYAAVGEVLERSEGACRQLVARAREHVRQDRPRFTPNADAESRLASAFASAMISGDITSLTTVLAEDAVLYSDGGGKRTAAINPIYGRDRILRFLAGVRTKRPPPTADTARLVRINGAPGFLLTFPDGIETLALEIAGDEIVSIYSVRNPDKLRHLS